MTMPSIQPVKTLLHPGRSMIHSKPRALFETVLLAIAIGLAGYAPRVIPLLPRGEYFAASYDCADLLWPHSGVSIDEGMEQIATLARNNIDWASWERDGPRKGRIQASGSVLVISQTAENHAKVALLFEKLRARMSSGWGWVVVREGSPPSEDVSQ